MRKGVLHVAAHPGPRVSPQISRGANCRFTLHTAPTRISETLVIGCQGGQSNLAGRLLNRATRRNTGITLPMLRLELSGPSQSPGTCFKMSVSPLVGHPRLSDQVF